MGKKNDSFSSLAAHHDGAKAAAKPGILSQPAHRPLRSGLSNVPNSLPGVVETSGKPSRQQQGDNVRRVVGIRKATAIFKDLEVNDQSKPASPEKEEEKEEEEEEEDVQGKEERDDSGEMYLTVPEVPEHLELPPPYDHSPPPYEDSRVPAYEPEENWDDEECLENEGEDDGYTTARSRGGGGDNTTGGVTTVLFPQYNSQARRELALAKHIVESTRTVEDFEDEYFDTSMVAEYNDDIFAYMKEQEVSTQYPET